MISTCRAALARRIAACCCLLGAVAVWLNGSTVLARTWQEGIVGGVPDDECNERECGDIMVYRYYLPANYDPSSKYPLLLFLHGAGDSGFDNQRQVNQYIGKMIDVTESQYPAILVAPQLHSAVGWSPDENLDRTVDILSTLFASYAVDMDRLYITGLSMGGFGTTEYLDYFHRRHKGTLEFAAAAPLSGAYVPASAYDVLRETPIWLAHGAQDPTVDVHWSRDTFRALAGLAPEDTIPFTETTMHGKTATIGNVRYTEMPLLGHKIWSEFYREDAFYEWLFAQSLAVPEPSLAHLSCWLLLICGRRAARNARSPRTT